MSKNFFTETENERRGREAADRLFQPALVKAETPIQKLTKMQREVRELYAIAQKQTKGRRR